MRELLRSFDSDERKGADLLSQERKIPLYRIPS